MAAKSQRHPTIERSNVGRTKPRRSEEKTILETPRLRLRTWALADAGAAFAIWGDPDVMRYVDDGRPKPNLNAIRESLRRAIEEQRERGVSLWPVIEKSNRQIVGSCGFHSTPLEGEYELGFHFARAYWGHGYATEAAEACVDYAFAKLGATRVVAFTHGQNAASQRILEKIGFERAGTERGELLYERRAPEKVDTHIRPFAPSDFDAVLAVASSLPACFPEERLAKLRVDLDFQRAFVATRNGQVIGFATYYVAAATGHLTWLGVDAERQRRGTGRALIEAICRELSGRRVELAYGYTWGQAAPEAREIALAFYRAAGFSDPGPDTATLGASPCLEVVGVRAPGP